MSKKTNNIKTSQAKASTNNPSELFDYKKAYKKYDSEFTTGVELIDFRDLRQLYGKIDHDGHAIYPSETNFSTLLSETAPQPVFAVNFVAEAFSDLRKYMRRAAFIKKIDINSSVLFNMNPVSAWRSPHKEYFDFLNQSYLLFFNDHIRKNKINENIHNFDTFMDTFVPFIKSFSSKHGIPFTFSAFIKHRACSPTISGLMINIHKADCNDDVLKKKKFLENPDFEFYRNTVKKFGFVIDKDIPWRLVADLSSNPMKKYMKNFGLKYKDVFSNYYYRSATKDLDIFKKYLIGFYNSLVASIPLVNKTKYCSDSMKTVSYLVERKTISEEHVATNYPIAYWIDRYVEFRRFETKSKLQDNDLSRLSIKIKRMIRVFDLSKIMLYIDNLIETHTGIDKHMFKQKSWIDFDYTPPPPRIHFQPLPMQETLFGGDNTGAVMSAFLGLDIPDYSQDD